MTSVQTKLTELEDQRQALQRSYERSATTLDAQIEVLKEVLTVCPSANGVHQEEEEPELPPTRGGGQPRRTSTPDNRAARIRDFARREFKTTFTTPQLIARIAAKMPGISRTHIYVAVQQLLRADELRIVGSEMSNGGRVVNVYQWV